MYGWEGRPPAAPQQLSGALPHASCMSWSQGVFLWVCPAQDSNQRGDPAAGFLDKGHLTSGFREGLLSSE